MKSTFKKLISKLLAKESVLVLNKYKPKVIAITGTVGKTSTKEAVYAALSEFEYVRTSKKNFNTDFGIPLTILDQGKPANIRNPLGWIEVLLEGLILIVFPHHYPKWLVLEVGTDSPGDIKEITEWLKPDIAIVTKLSDIPVHVENFPSPEMLFNEKGNLVRAVKPGGTVILNAEDEKVLKYRELTNENVLLYGNAQGSDITAEKYEILYENDMPIGVKFDVSVSGVSYPIVFNGTLGAQHVQHVLATMAVMKLLGENLSVAARSFSKEIAPPGRMRIIEGMNKSVIIDDTYNSSPIAVEEALKTLKELKGKRKVAVLGDMLELGKFSVEAHKNVGEKAATSADVLVAVGIRSRYSAEAASAAGMEKVHTFDTSREAAKFVKQYTEEGDVILVKGSQGARMEKVVEEIVANPKLKKLLVRQEKEWKDK